jgi:DNA-binding MurR/RpiR family transcriptional regulator
MEQVTPSMIDFSQIISSNYRNLTKSEKRIANYLRKNQEESAFLAAGEIADRLGLSEATLVRFARTLGFTSYPAMRSLLQDAFRHRVTHSERLRGRLEDLRQGGDIFERLVVSEIDYLTQALDTVDREGLQKSVDLIKSSRRIYVFGGGPSISLANLLEIRLRRFGKEVIPLTTSGREVLEPLMLMNDQDLLLMICFFDISPTQKLVLDYANEVHCPVILLTDTLGSIIGDQADIVLAARRGPMAEFHSLVVPMTIINTLLLAYANEDREKVMENLDNLDQMRERLKIAIESM